MRKALLSLACILSAIAAGATPPNTPTLDGRPIEYDDYDFKDSFHGASFLGAEGTLTNLYVTWDADYLYLALQAWKGGRYKLVVLLDADPGAGTGATATTNWTGNGSSYLAWNGYAWTSGGGFGLDYLFASEGTYNNAIRVLYDGVEPPDTNNTASIFDSGNGSSPLGTPIDMACRTDSTACPHKGLEVRIPWSNVYSSARFGTVEPGETVPRGASLRLLAGIFTNDNAVGWSSPDTIPNQAVEDYTNGAVTTLDYMQVGVDTDTNGIPDLFGANGNAPYIRDAVGAVGGSYVTVGFNEPVTAGTVENTANWTVGGAAPVSAAVQSSRVVLLGLAAPIASTDLLPIRAEGVEDPDGFSRVTEHCLFPAASGIPQEVAVTFQVYTNSGMGVSASHARPTAFFVNGSSLPLEWGYPPLETVALAAIPGSNGWAAATITFPPGSPTELNYKYSGRLYGTNTFEAIRLTDFTEGARQLVLSSNGAPMTVVDHLGAAAHPLRNPADTNLPSAQNKLYTDARRGDAGVRVNREVLFRLDLTGRRRDNLTRVMVMGSDPLRGFNSTGDNTGGNASDYPNNSVYLSWTNAGVQLVDDGTLGDEAAGDGVYSRLWSFATNGYDSAVETNSPYSLVGGHAADWLNDLPGTEPYLGDAYWLARRSPRSLLFKFYAVIVSGSTTNTYESPSRNIEYYVQDPDATERIELDPFVWDDAALPLPPPSNAPALTGVSLTGATAYVQFENLLSEVAHGVRVATNLLDASLGFADYGLRATRISTNGGVGQWSAVVAQISSNKEFYAPYAGLEPDPLPHFWEPSHVPATACVWRAHFSQYKDSLFAGNRAMAISGSWNGWSTETPMTFLGDGHWIVDIPLPDVADATLLEYKFRSGGTWAYDPNNKTLRGGPVTWTPDQPAPEDLFAITLDVAGTAMAAATNVNVHLGFPPGAWSGRPMTNTGGSVWAYSVAVPSNAAQSVSWVFNAQTNGSATVKWYHPDDLFSGTGSGSANWHAFLAPLVNP